MMLSQSLRIYPGLKQIYRLGHAQKLSLRYLLELKLNLKDVDFPNPTKGLEGMLAAHEILRQKNLPGVLIGGLSEAVWNRRRKEEDLGNHKDVDVAVLDGYSDINIGRFEGGIDWWLPRQGTLTIKSEGAEAIGIEKQWWYNGNNVVLSYGLRRNDSDQPLQPGLHIPGPEWIKAMRRSEVEAHIDSARLDVEIDGSVWRAFEKKMDVDVKKRLPGYITSKFKNYIISPPYSKRGYAIDIIDMDLPTIRAINDSIRAKIRI